MSRFGCHEWSPRVVFRLNDFKMEITGCTLA
jgi:hypothetical protein